MKKRKQHYVWRKYLKPWAVHGYIWCHRGGKIFRSALMGVANERDFYRLRELTEKEIAYVEKIGVGDASEPLREVLVNFLGIFTYAHELRNEYERNGSKNAEAEGKIDELINNTEEDLHAKIESSGDRFLASILKLDTGFFEIEDDRITFEYYLAVQYLRTKKMKENVIAATSYQKEVNVENIWNVLSHMMATRLGRNLVANKEMKLVLLINNTKSPFITGDQPVINTFAVGKLVDEEASELELYYPVSPFLAILITKREIYRDTGIVEIEDESTVNKYNLDIVQEVREQTYSDSEEFLLRYFPGSKR